MRSARVIPTLAVVLAVASAGPATAQICPQVYEYVDVGGGIGNPAVPASKTFNLLFLGNGFTGDDGLDTYRRAMQLFVQSLRTTPPYDGYLDRMKFFYMDLDSESTGIDCSCAGPVPATSTAPTPGVPVDTPFPGGSDVDLEVSCTCGLGSTCTGLDMPVTRQAEALGLSFCAPNIRAIVVIANADCPAGLTYQYEPLVSVSWAIVGVEADGTVTSDLVLEDGGPMLFQHELGHLLGLLDEYDYGSGGWLFPTRRNIWKKRGLPPDWLPDPMRPTCPTIAWERAMCPSGRNATPPNRCDIFLADCCDTAATPDWSDTPPLVRSGCSCSPTSLAGLWEGGFYRTEDYYRASYACPMSEIDPSLGLCPACQRHLSDVLCRYGAYPGTVCPEPIPDWTGVCGVPPKWELP